MDTAQPITIARLSKFMQWYIHFARIRCDPTPPLRKFIRFSIHDNISNFKKSFCFPHVRRTPRRCHQHRWIHLLVAIFIGLVAVDTCDAANNILQPTNDVMLSHGQRNNDSYVHLSDGKILKRDKRFLLFTGGGISKVRWLVQFACITYRLRIIQLVLFGMFRQVVLGFLAPVETRDRVNWRTLNLAYNFQAQYVPIPSVIYLWDRFSRSLIDQRRRYDADGTFTKDLTRSLVYAALEMFLDRKGKPGRQCLLKAMCEAAEHPIERINVFDEIAHLVLTWVFQRHSLSLHTAYSERISHSPNW